jgi:hypothetical protein
MENLTEKVYECTLPVEAHMICDLLARAGISARVDGEFLAGAGGELPMGSSIKVRVEPARAAEARAVIDEWEKAQPPDSATAAVPKRPPLRGPLWFFLGAIGGAGFAYVGLNTPAGENGIDYDGDGDYEITYRYAGRKYTLTEKDRDNDGRTDARWHFDLHGLEKSYEADDDFDGRFEWKFEFENGEFVRGERDADGDGKPEFVAHYSYGVVKTEDIFDEAGNRVVAREHYSADRVKFTEFDRDGDGTFEQRVEFDRYGLPK